MKKLLFLTMFSLSVAVVNAKDAPTLADSLLCENTTSITDFSKPLEPTYIENVCEGSSWGSHWFVEAKGGASAFIGSPTGKGNIFNRTMPALQLAIGKWFTPDVGTRIVFQGFSFKNANLDKMRYQLFHADLLWNINGRHNKTAKGLSRLDIVPYVGIGIIHNADWERICKCSGSAKNSHPIALSYGVQIQYPLYKRLGLLAEVGGICTLKSFDNINLSEDFGDNMLNISVGLSISLGKTGWKKFIDARPYVQQNAYLIAENSCLREQLNTLIKNSATINKKVSESNLEEHHTDTIALDMPVFFYFKRNTTDLVNTTQLSNLEEIAAIVKGTDYRICITGAADQATGTVAVNQELSERRARFIADEFVKCGISGDRIIIHPRGGIGDYNPMEANRNTCVTVVR